MAEKKTQADGAEEVVRIPVREIHPFDGHPFKVLDDELMQDTVDSKEIAFTPAVELSYLSADEQKQFLDAMDYSQNTPSLSQAQRIKKLSQTGRCSQEAMYDIMSEEKKDELDRIVLRTDVLRKYFPRSYTPQKMEETILRLLEAWQKKRERGNER